MFNLLSKCGSCFSPSSSPVSKYDRTPALADALPRLSLELIGIIGEYTNEILSGLYGPESWNELNKDVVVLDPYIAAPPGDLNNRFLIYIPQQVRFREKVSRMGIEVLKILSENKIMRLNKSDMEEVDASIIPGWIYIERFPEKIETISESSEKMLEERNASLPHVFETAIFYLMTLKFSEELYKGSREVCTLCNNNTWVEWSREEDQICLLQKELILGYPTIFTIVVLGRKV
jgi:hypothetical protein